MQLWNKHFKGRNTQSNETNAHYLQWTDLSILAFLLLLFGLIEKVKT